MISKRLKVSLITGALLGLFCIVGATFRGTVTSGYLLFSLWYNRIIMAVIIGVIEKPTTLSNRLLRGVSLGFLVSFAYYASVGFTDFVSFVAGIVYGMIIEFVAFKMDK